MGPTSAAYLSKHVEGYVHCGQEGSEGGGHFRVKGGSGETQGKEEVVFSKIQRLKDKIALWNKAQHSILQSPGSRLSVGGQCLLCRDEYLVQEDLADVWGEVAEGCQGPAENLEKAILDCV